MIGKSGSAARKRCLPAPLRRGLAPARLRFLVLFGSGAPGRIRTHDPQIRSLVLYPAELPVLSPKVTTPRQEAAFNRAALLIRGAQKCKSFDGAAGCLAPGADPAVSVSRGATVAAFSRTRRRCSSKHLASKSARRCQSGPGSTASRNLQGKRVGISSAGSRPEAFAPAQHRAHHRFSGMSQSGRLASR